MRCAAPLALTLALLAACGSPQQVEPPVIDTAVAEPEVVVPVPGANITPFDGWPFAVEAWPTARADEPVERVTDGTLETGAYRPDDSVPRPWSVVFALDDGPRQIAAIGIVLDSDVAPAAESVTVFGYLGNVPLTRANYGQMIEGSVRLGVSEVTDEGVFTVLELPEPRLLHYVWVRLSTPRADQHVGIAEVALYAPAHLDALRQRAPGDVQFASLVAVDATPYHDTSISGLPVIDAADIDPAEEIERFQPPTLPQHDDSESDD